MFKLVCTTLLILINLSVPISAGEMKLKWVKEDKIGKSLNKHGHEDWTRLKESASLKVLSASIKRDKLEFKLLFHNPTNHYICYIVTADKSTVLMDDELGNEYQGAVFKPKKGFNNKLAPNQRKQGSIIVDAPEEGISLVNVHFGFHFIRLASNDLSCTLKKGRHYNFHKLDWDISDLRKE